MFPSSEAASAYPPDFRWFTEMRPLLGADGSPAAWPSERGVRGVSSGWIPASSPTAGRSA